MCYELFLIHPRCHHVKSVVGQTVYCFDYQQQGRRCASTSIRLPKQWNYYISNIADLEFVNGKERSWNSAVADRKREEPGYCRNCSKGYSQPLKGREVDDFIERYMGDVNMMKRQERDREMAEEEQRRELELEFAKMKALKRKEGLKGGKKGAEGKSNMAYADTVDEWGDQKGRESSAISSPQWLDGQNDEEVERLEGERSSQVDSDYEGTEMGNLSPKAYMNDGDIPKGMLVNFKVQSLKTTPISPRLE